MQLQTEERNLLATASRYCKAYEKPITALFILFLGLLWAQAAINWKLNVPRTALIILCLPALLIAHPLPKATVKSPAIWAWFALIACAGVSTMLSPLPTNGARGVIWNWVSYGIIGYCSAALLREKAVYIASSCAVVLCLQAILLLAAPATLVWLGHALDGSFQGIWSHAQRLRIFLDPNSLGGLCVGSLLIVFYCVAQQKTMLVFLAYTVVVCGNLAILFLTNSRSSILGIILTVLIILWIKVKYKLRFFLGMLACGAVIAGLATVFVSDETPHLKRITEVLRNPSEDIALATRLPLWDTAWQGLKKRPLLGNGVRSFNAIHKEYLVENFAQLKEEFTQLGVGVERNMHHGHNIYLNILVELGGLGLLFFSFLAVWVIWIGIKGGFPLACWYMLYILLAGLTTIALHQKVPSLFLFFLIGMQSFFWAEQQAHVPKRESI